MWLRSFPVSIGDVLQFWKFFKVLKEIPDDAGFDFEKLYVDHLQANPWLR